MTFNVVGLGEVLWDLLPSGPQLGGAPTNFAYQAGALGANASVITRVGSDILGRQVIQRFGKLGLPPDIVQTDLSRPTGTVSVTLSPNGLAHYAFAEDVAWEYLEATPLALQTVRGAHAVCFGTLGQRSATSRKAIQRLIAAAPVDALRIFDINLRLGFYSREIIEESMHLSNVLKMNDVELDVLTTMFSLQGSERQRIEWLVCTFGLNVVVLTRGPLGSVILQDRQWSEIRPPCVPVTDTVGAGDAFAAALTMGLLCGKNLDETHAMADEMARYVCSQSGGTPPMPEMFRGKLA